MVEGVGAFVRAAQGDALSATLGTSSECLLPNL